MSLLPSRKRKKLWPGFALLAGLLLLTGLVLHVRQTGRVAGHDPAVLGAGAARAAESVRGALSL